MNVKRFINAYSLTRGSRKFVKAMNKKNKHGITMTPVEQKTYNVISKSVKIDNTLLKNIRNFWNEVGTTIKELKNLQVIDDAGFNIPNKVVKK